MLPNNLAQSGDVQELDRTFQTNEELEDLTIADGLGLEICVYKHLILAKRHAGEKWHQFILDPIRRLSFRQAIQVLAQFFTTEYVIYVPGGCLSEFETYTYSQLIIELQNKKCQLVPVQALAEQVELSGQIFRENSEFGCIEQFHELATLTHLQSLANLQLAILTLALKQDDIDYLNNKYSNNKDLFEQLETNIYNFPNWTLDVKNNVFTELTEKQFYLINLLSEQLTNYLNGKFFKIAVELPFQKLAEEILFAFAWNSLDLDDWFEEELTNEEQ